MSFVQKKFHSLTFQELSEAWIRVDSRSWRITIFCFRTSSLCRASWGCGNKVQEGKINLEDQGVGGWRNWGERSHATYFEVIGKLDDFLERKNKGIQNVSKSPETLWHRTYPWVGLCRANLFYFGSDRVHLVPMSMLSTPLPSRKKMPLHPSQVYHGIPECQSLILSDSTPSRWICAYLIQNCNSVTGKRRN